MKKKLLWKSRKILDLPRAPSWGCDLSFHYSNLKLYFQVVCLIELPSYFFTNILMEKIGRKKTMIFGMIGSGIFCILSELVEGTLEKTIFFIIGKVLITIAFSCLYIFTIEVFPTSLRHRFFSICSVVGRIGSILTPLTPILAQYVASSLPLILFSAFSLSSALLLFTLPETLNRKMPESVQEAFEWIFNHFTIIHKKKLVQMKFK